MIFHINYRGNIHLKKPSFRPPSRVSKEFCQKGRALETAPMETSSRQHAGAETKNASQMKGKEIPGEIQFNSYYKFILLIHMHSYYI
jgi:hypothetical protein